MAGISPYFGNPKNSVMLAGKSVLRHYKTRKRNVMIEYESNVNVAPTMKSKKENPDDSIIEELIERNKPFVKNEILCEYDTNCTVSPYEEAIPNNNCTDNKEMIEKEKSLVRNEISYQYDLNCSISPSIKIENNNPDNTTDIKEAEMKECIKNDICYAVNKSDMVKAGGSKGSVIKNENSTWEPKNWEIILNNIKEMRKHRTAVVDTLGCERLSDKWEKPEVIRFQTFTSLLLSAQTRDQMTAAAVGRLKKHGLNIPNIMKTPESKLGKLIYPVGFWKRKATYLKKCAIICHDKYNDDIPNNVKELVSLPGFGPKMAHICMNAAWGEVSGIGVDTHLHRIANRLRWVKKTTKTPDKTRIELESWLPIDEWKDINILLVGFGQETCLPRYPKCQICLNKDICPAAGEEMKNKGKRKKLESKNSS